MDWQGLWNTSQPAIVWESMKRVECKTHTQYLSMSGSQDLLLSTNSSGSLNIKHTLLTVACTFIMEAGLLASWITVMMMRPSLTWLFNLFKNTTKSVWLQLEFWLKWHSRLGLFDSMSGDIFKTYSPQLVESTCNLMSRVCAWGIFAKREKTVTWYNCYLSLVL